MTLDKNKAFEYKIGEAIPVTVGMDNFRLTRDLLDRIVEAENIALKNEIEANSVVVNGRKYGMLKKRGLIPTVFGMKLETRADMPDDWDFFVQHKEPEPLTNADRIRAMSDEELADWLYKHDFCITPFNSDAQNWCEGDCEPCIDSWLKSPVEVET